MVMTSGGPTFMGVWLCAAERAQPLIQKLDQPTRAKVLAALAGLVILAFGLMALAWLGARATRRYMRREGAFRRDLRRVQPHGDDWAEKRLVPPAVDAEPDEDV